MPSFTVQCWSILSLAAFCLAASSSGWSFRSEVAVVLGGLQTVVLAIVKQNAVLHRPVLEHLVIGRLLLGGEFVRLELQIGSCRSPWRFADCCPCHRKAECRPSPSSAGASCHWPPFAWRRVRPAGASDRKLP